MTRLDEAKRRYAAYGIDVEAAWERLDQVAISMHCWQGDDVVGLEASAGALSGGIQTTGNYPGRARNSEELMADYAKALTMIGGRKRINLHASYALLEGEAVDRDAYEGRHFDGWIAFAREQGIGIDFNPTFFSHPKVKDGLTLSSPDEEIRQFWVRHGIQSRRIASYMGEKLGDEVLNNIWIPDGMKDVTGDRTGLRARLKESLDQILAEELPNVVDAVESKVFGIGLEAMTVGSAEFYLAYAASRPGVYPLIDAGHYHPTESVADKISALLLFFDRLPFHVTRPMRWDSDHVVSFDDATRQMAEEMVRSGHLDRCMMGLDFFDASINRVAAWVIGTRNMQKALLYALLQNVEELKRLQDAADFTELLVLHEEYKTLPFGEVWDAWCERQGVPVDGAWLAQVKAYEADVLLKRG